MEILIIKENQTVLDFNSKEVKAKHILKSKQFKTATVITMTTLMILNGGTAFAGTSTAHGITQINQGGNMIMDIVKAIGWFICWVGCVIEILRSLMQGDTKSIAKIMMKYALGFSALYMFPWLMELIKSVFA